MSAPDPLTIAREWLRTLPADPPHERLFTEHDERLIECAERQRNEGDDGGGRYGPDVPGAGDWGSGHQL